MQSSDSEGEKASPLFCIFFFLSLGARRSFAKKKKKKLKIRKSQGTKNRQMVMRRKGGERGGPIKKKDFICLFAAGGETYIYIYIFVFRPSSRPNQPRRF